MNHDIKAWPEFFEEILADRKRAELRYNDRNYAVGDLLTIREFYTDARGYSGRVVVRIITHMVTSDNFIVKGVLQPGWVVMSIAPAAYANREPVDKSEENFAMGLATGVAVGLAS